MNKHLNFICQAAMIAAVYIILTFTFSPFASGVIQVRIAEALTILPYFTSAAIPGLAIGCFFSNLFTGCVLWDILFGAIATLLGAFGSYAIRKHQWLVPLPPILANVILVPFVLRYAYGVPDAIPFLMTTIGIGETISCYVLGMSLLFVLKIP